MRKKSCVFAFWTVTGIILFVFLYLNRPIELKSEKHPLNLISEYERLQSSKFNVPKWFDRIRKMDEQIIQPQLYKRFGSVFREQKFTVKGKTALCIGARQGGEVRAIQNLGALAIGVDFNPGEKNKHVLYGSATDLQFSSGVFDIIYSNILDHIDDIDTFFSEVFRVAKNGSFLLLDLDQNKPDKWSVRDLRGQVELITSKVQNMGWTLLTRKVINNEKDRGKIALVFLKK